MRTGTETQPTARSLFAKSDQQILQQLPSDFGAAGEAFVKGFLFDPTAVDSPLSSFRDDPVRQEAVKALTIPAAVLGVAAATVPVTKGVIAAGKALPQTFGFTKKALTVGLPSAAKTAVSAVKSIPGQLSILVQVGKRTTAQVVTTPARLADSIRSSSQFLAFAGKEGAKSIYPPRDEPWKMRSSMIADPEGNLIEIGSDFWE